MKSTVSIDLVEDAYILMHPFRYRLVELLSEKPMHINELAKAMGEERRLVSYHLITLEQYGFVGSKYEISEDKKSKGKAIRKFWVNDKVQTILYGIKTEL